jgi:DNA-binding transcriptional ArsR family regulator
LIQPKGAPVKSEAMRATLRITKALADIQRVRILMMLQPGERCVCQIVEVLALAPSTVSKHLSVLSDAGLVDVRKDGRWAWYRLLDGAAAASAEPVLAWLAESLEGDTAIRADRKALRAAVACTPENLCRRQRRRMAEAGAS